jgi:hypothetical protein
VRRTGISAGAHHAAYHEAGHCIATLLAFRDAKWLPRPMPRSLIGYVEIVEDAPGQWSGNCVSQDIYSPNWSIDRLTEPYRPLMEWQVVIELAGGLAEAIHRGERNEPLWFATRHCGTGTDRRRATSVLTDLYHPISPANASRSVLLLNVHRGCCWQTGDTSKPWRPS